PLGIFLAAFELVLGIVLILGYQKKITYWVLLVFMSSFTILTFFLAIFNPVTDCGCFGDAIIMTNWQTFLKNVILMAFVLILFYSRKRAKNLMRNRLERILVFTFFIGSFILSIFCILHLPLIDFRPYDVGTHIRSEMEIPEDAQMDVYSTTLYYRNLKTGETQEFTLENYPKDTLLWEFATSESKLISKGYEPPIHDFGLTDEDVYDYTDELLTDDGYSLMMVSYDLEKADYGLLQSMNDWNNLQNISGDFNFVPITASGSSLREELAGELGLEYSFYSADEIMLKTMVRSNPGFVLLKNGTILAKWSHRDFPGIMKWDNEWTELIDQFVSERDPEILMLIEEGIMEEIQWDVVDFDEAALQLVTNESAGKKEAIVWMIFYAALILVMILLQLPLANNSKNRG
ncbi:BT_3928 family protein, partial [Bacteroidota bacterium]